MKKLIAGVCFAVVGTVGLVASDRTSVTITGCVRDGDGANTYVITNVAQTSPQAQNPATDIYWLTSTKGLKDMIGHRVQVTGLVSAKDDEGKTGKVKVQTSADGKQKVSVDTPTHDADTTLHDPAAAGAEKSKVEVSRPVRTLHVRSMKMLSATCL